MKDKDYTVFSIIYVVKLPRCSMKSFTFPLQMYKRVVSDSLTPSKINQECDLCILYRHQSPSNSSAWLSAAPANISN